MTDEFAGRVADRCCCDTYGFKLDRCDSLQQTTHKHAASCTCAMGTYADAGKRLLASYLQENKMSPEVHIFTSCFSLGMTKETKAERQRE